MFFVSDLENAEKLFLKYSRSPRFHPLNVSKVLVDIFLFFKIVYENRFLRILKYSHR